MIQEPAAVSAPAEIYYSLQWRPAAGMSGSHRSVVRGDGFEFDAHIPLGEGADPRRFDLRASARDPLQRILVRRYRQTSAVGVTVLADLSTSMRVVRGVCKLDILADFIRSLGWSVYQQGDSFAFFAAGDQPLQQFCLPASRSRGAADVLIPRLAALRGDAITGVCDASGLPDTARQIPRRRNLVFLLSDFYIPQKLICDTLDALSAHTVIPIMLVDSAEHQSAPRFGLTEFVDVESAVRRQWFMRPSLRRSYRQAFANHRTQLRDLCQSRGAPLLVLEDHFSATAVTRHFVEQ